jgi:5'(3')-deoxyribonucleotidase
VTIITAEAQWRELQFQNVGGQRRNMPDPKFVLGVDLDGVVVDFYGGLRPIAAEWLGLPIQRLTTEVSYGLPEWQLEKAGGYDALHRFAVTQREFFRLLKPMEGAPVTLRRLSARYEIRIRIITHRLFTKHFHQAAVKQTIAWLDHYDIPYWDLCFVQDKAAVGADLYLEDSPHNVTALRADGHDVIVFTNSTNRSLMWVLLLISRWWRLSI